MAGKKLTKEQICRRDYDKLYQLVTQRLKSDGTFSFDSVNACNSYIEPTLNNHWFCHILATQNGHRPSGLRRTMIRMLRFGLQKERKINITTNEDDNARVEADSHQPASSTEQESVNIDPRILEVARTVHTLGQKQIASGSDKHETRPVAEDNNRQSTPASLVERDLVDIDPWILEIARTVQSLAQSSTATTSMGMTRDSGPSLKQTTTSEVNSDEIVCIGSTNLTRIDASIDQSNARQAFASNEPLKYRLNIVQRHRGLSVWELSVRQVSAMIWEGKVHLQQFLNHSTSLSYSGRRQIIRHAKFFPGTKILAKKDWLVPPAFLARHAKLAKLEAEAAGFINLASSHIAKPPKTLRCSHCSESHTIAFSDLKDMYKHVRKCVGIAEGEQIYGFCACGRLYATETDYDQHGQGCSALQQVMGVIMG